MLIRLSKRPLKKILRLSKDDLCDIWALDEVHFQQYGSRCRMWIPPEVKEPVLLHHPTGAGVGYYGAVRLRDGGNSRIELKGTNSMAKHSFPSSNN
jgi:hypothetical protein